MATALESRTRPTNLEITQSARMRPIAEVAAELGLTDDEYEPYGRHKAKIPPVALERRLDGPAGKLVSVTAITPTKFGEGKTTTAIGLTEALSVIGSKPLLCLREPSMGPVFGIKGGGGGAGLAQVVPMEELNLHFTGDIHAIGAATNLLAAMIDAHLLHGNALGIDPLKITWRRALDVNDRALRSIVTGLGGHANGHPRETGFDITAASEVMAIVAVARDLDDLRERIGRITVARTHHERRVTAEDLGAAGSMTVLLKDALKPNLVQTLEGQPVLVHGGPFANIAHGNNSLVADLLGLRLADYVVTESGFGSDMGFEKFADIVCRLGGIAPSVVVLVATVRALKHHGGDPDGGLGAIERGAANLARHIEIVSGFGVAPVVAVNRFPTDTRSELLAVRELAIAHGAQAAEISAGFEDGGAGVAALAEAVSEVAEAEPVLRFAYDLDDPIPTKLQKVATQVYGAADIALSPEAQRTIAACTEEGLDRLPICMAKTHLSLSHSPALVNAPSGYTLPIREIRPYTGAGWLVALCGDMMTMPGLSAEPAALRIDVDSAGRTVGLY
ncbi:MAG TPA: formate--tetrahydrofolate ligase [Gaiellaceae bacterium]|nr:formate--tetrahydrofolate ligase [Gaiellaceae bacterium]